MFIQPYYIIKDQASLIKLLGEENHYFNYVVEIDTTDLQKLEEIYRNIYKVCANNFCIYLKPGNAQMIPEQVIEYLISLSFHYKYKCPALNELFLLIDPIDPAFQHYITDQFIAQGYEKINYKTIVQPSTKDIEDNEFYLINNLEIIEDAYYNFLRTSMNSNKQIIISNDSYKEDIDHIITKLENAENRLQINDPAIYNLLELNKKTGQSIESLNDRIRYYQEALEVKKSGASTAYDSDYRKKIIDIVEFYHYEYEILPSWFKKFGHIIKVLIGKRSFRSLFNDNVKKYKD
jgi:hypothetical protein